LLALDRYCEKNGINAEIVAKIEAFNPAGSAKDRVALQMILAAEEAGILKPGAAIIEPTSGNTGIGLAWVGVTRGYRVILTMPDTMSVERQNLIRAYGAEIVLTEGAKGMAGSIEKAQELKASMDGAVILGQFTNLANPLAHYRTTGPEVWADTEGKIDVFVATVGTGGTLSGTAKYLKEQNPAIRVVAVEPAASPLLSGGKAAPHKIQGIGANFIPDNLERALIDEVVHVTEEEAYAAARTLARTEGILVGISSGAALHAASLIAKRPVARGKVIAVILPDAGDRYLSTPLFTQN
jgi:cysteine synthase A